MAQAYACAFSDALVDYELAFAIENFAQTPAAKSEMLGRIAEKFRTLGIEIGTPPMDVRIIRRNGAGLAPVAKSPPKAATMGAVESL